MFRQILRIPVIGTFIYILNCFVYSGDDAASSKPAPPSRWRKALLPQLSVAAALMIATTWSVWRALIRWFTTHPVLLSDFSSRPGEIVHSIFPSLLGFGIGVYALLFALSPKFVQGLDTLLEKKKNAGEKADGSVLMLNSDMAYPIVVLLGTTAIGAMQRAWPESLALILLTWTFFWYGLIVTLELIGVLFGLGNNSLLEKKGLIRTENSSRDL